MISLWWRFLPSHHTTVHWRPRCCLINILILSSFFVQLAGNILPVCTSQRCIRQQKYWGGHLFSHTMIFDANRAQNGAWCAWSTQSCSIRLAVLPYRFFQSIIGIFYTDHRKKPYAQKWPLRFCNLTILLHSKNLCIVTSVTVNILYLPNAYVKYSL